MKSNTQTVGQVVVSADHEITRLNVGVSGNARLDIKKKASKGLGNIDFSRLGNLVWMRFIGMRTLGCRRPILSRLLGLAGAIRLLLASLDSMVVTAAGS